MMKIGLIAIGDEILSGRRQDKHLGHLVSLLDARGLELSWARFVRDDRQAIVAVLEEAFKSHDLVFCCGGIGSTPDDHTRQCAALALNRPMLPHPEAQALIWERIQTLGQEKGWPVEPDHPDTLRRLEMGVFPEGASIVPNSYNQIPGFSVGTVYFLPGFPVMAWPMMAWVLDEHYAHLHGSQATTELFVIVQGTMEATLTPLMVDIENKFPGVKVFSLPSVAHEIHGPHIELGVKGKGHLVEEAFVYLQQQLNGMGVHHCTTSDT